MTPEATRGLARHIMDLQYARGNLGDPGWPVARGILADPQGHIDALVAAGVLEACTTGWSYSHAQGGGQISGPGYRIPPAKPTHEHDWWAEVSAQGVAIRCDSCPERSVFMAKRLPIEVPG